MKPDYFVHFKPTMNFSDWIKTDEGQNALWPFTKKEWEGLFKKYCLDKIAKQIDKDMMKK